MFWKIFLLLTIFAIGESQKQNLDWWQTSVIYQIYPRSYMDSNADGVGDLKGIQEMASYFKEVGIGAVWLNPINASPMFDLGYDISDYKKIDPVFGSMDDFMSLMEKLRSLDIKLIMDFVPNHTSDQHIWFNKSINREDPYTNYYVWKDPKGWTNAKTPIPPNNWRSAFDNGSAWTYVPQREQFYLHQFSAKQPDLNYRSKAVMEEMKDVLKFYLDLAVDGYRVDAIPFLVEDGRFLDEPLVNGKSANDGTLTYADLEHIYTMDQPETYDIIEQFRRVLDTYTAKGGPTRILLTEAYTSINATIDYYGTQKHPEAQIPFNFLIITNLNDMSTAKDFSDTVHLWIDNVPKGRWPNWVLGNHDQPRVPTRFEPAMVDGLNMLVTLLPGTAITYYGEEIGMEDTNIRFDQTVDMMGRMAGPQNYVSVSRDPERTPFQWNSSLHAGFSKRRGNTWEPVNPNYPNLNLEEQKKNPKSHYNIYKQLLKLRSNEVIQLGDLKTYVLSKYVFAFERSMPGKEKFLVIMNLNNQEEYITSTSLRRIVPGLPKKMSVYIASGNSEYNAGDKIYIGKNDVLSMIPKTSVVLTSKG